MPPVRSVGLKLKSTSSRNARISTVLTLIAASGSVLFLLFKVGVLIRFEIKNWSYDGWMILSYFFFLLGYLPISAFALALAGVSILKKEPNRKTARNVILLLAGLVLPLLMIFYGLYLHGNLPR